MSIYYGQSWYRDNLSKQNLGINTTISTPITFADSLEFSRILEEFADSNSNHPIFLTGSLLLNPIYANSSSPAYTPIKYHLATNGLTYELTSNSTNPKELSHYPSLTQIPHVNSNIQKAINDITKEYALSLETIGDYYLLNKDFDAANTRYFQASQINSEYFDQNRLSEKLKIDHKN